MFGLCGRSDAALPAGTGALSVVLAAAMLWPPLPLRLAVGLEELVGRIFVLMGNGSFFGPNIYAIGIVGVCHPRDVRLASHTCNNYMHYARIALNSFHC